MGYRSSRSCQKSSLTLFTSQRKHIQSFHLLSPSSSHAGWHWKYEFLIYTKSINGSDQSIHPFRGDVLSPPELDALEARLGPKSATSCGSDDPKTLQDAQNASRPGLLDLIPSKNWSESLLKVVLSVSRSAPLLPRLHPHATGWIIHHVHQPPGVTAALGPRMGCWLLQWPGGRVDTWRLTGHLPLNADDRGWSGAQVRFLTQVRRANALEKHPRLQGGFGAMLSHIVSQFPNDSLRIQNKF